MSRRTIQIAAGLAASAAAFMPLPSSAQVAKPNIVLILSDDFGWGDMGVYGGGDNRGAATPNLDRIAAEGMQFLSNYGQPSCTPGRAAVMTGRIPNHSGMTTVAFQGQGGGLPTAEWTLGSVLKTAGYSTFFTGKWHLGEADYALPNAQGFDEMRYVGLYTSTPRPMATPPGFPTCLRSSGHVQPGDKGAMSGKAGEAAHEDFKINGQYVNTPDKGVVGIPFFDEYVEKASLEYLDQHAHSDKPFFMSINFMKVHQPNMPAPDFIGKSAAKTKFGDSVVENDTRIGHIMDKIRELNLDKNTYVFWTTDNGAWQDVYPDAGYTPYRGTKGTDREGGARVPALAWGPGIKPASSNSEIVGGLDYMATFAALGGAKLPETTARASRSSSTATTCRRSCSARVPIRARAGSISPRTSSRRARCAWAGSRPCSTCAATTARRPADLRSTRTSAGKVRRNTWRRCRRSTISGRTRRNATTFS